MKYINLLCLLMVANTFFAQEVMLFNSVNHSNQQSSLKSDVSVPNVAFQHLPFYEDFSAFSQSPDPEKWIGTDVFINDYFAVNQPTIGVATFDALDANGMLHATASSASFAADTLTSAPIALGDVGTIADTAILSFYYQVGGLDYQDNWPSAKDSLMLEFYAPSPDTGFFINEMGALGIELYNASDDTIDISGFTLRVVNDTTDIGYTVKEGASGLLYPYSYSFLVKNDFIVPDGYGPMAYGTGDSIFCFSPDRQYADSIQYSNASEYGTYGREVDGSQTFKAFSTASFGKCNGDWVYVWSASGIDNPDEYTDDFNYVSLSFDQFQEFLVDGFRFRFINYASLSSSPTHARNADYFNLDQIYLDINRKNKKDLPDAAFSRPLVSFLKDYYTVPFTHFAGRQSIYNESVYFFRCRNFDAGTRKVKYSLSVQRLFDPYTAETVSLYETDLPGESVIDDTLNLSRFLNPIDIYLEDAGTRKEAQYQVQMFLDDDDAESHKPYRFNDTLRFIQDFGNYYAYDDGTSEAGYGVRGEKSMAVAQKFTIYEKDTLRAVSFFFNQTLDDPNLTAKRFKLAVWGDNGKGQPGDLLYESPKMSWVDKVSYERNGFQYIFLEPANGPLVVEGTIHVGWVQTSDFLMNVGVDLNRTVTNKVNYRFGELWTAAYMKNPLMIHAHVGSDFEVITSEKNNPNLAEQISIYPTFAKNELHVKGCTNAVAHVFNLMGEQVFTAVAGDEEIIDMSTVPSGLYIVSVVKKGELLAVEKIFVQR